MKANPSVEELKALTESLTKGEHVVLLPEEQEKALVRQYREGNPDALSALLEANIRFVVSVAKNYQDKGLDTPELIAAGTKGLVQAAQNFDETQGFRFLAYAIWWIRQSILLRSMDKDEFGV